METEGRTFIAKGAHVVTDLHQLVDACEEKALGEGKVGTTGKGEQATERSCWAYAYHTSFKTCRHRASIQHQDEQEWNPHSRCA